MGTINILKALESKEIKDARLQGTDVLSIKLPTNELYHVKLKSLVAEYEGPAPWEKKKKAEPEEKKGLLGSKKKKK